MLVQLAYGKTGYSVELPETELTILTPADLPAIPDPYGATLETIRNPLGTQPLRHMVTSNDTVAIYLGDLEKQISTPFIISCLMRDLSHVPNNQINIIFNYSSIGEDPNERIHKMHMGELFRGIYSFNHNPFDKSEQKSITSNWKGGIFLLNKVWLDSSKRITIGLVKPHPFIGFTGGYDLIVPGLAAIDTVNQIYDDSDLLNTDFLGQSMEHNPLQRFHTDFNKSGKPDFNINFTTNNQGMMTSVFAGKLSETHMPCMGIAKRAALLNVDTLFDIVLTTNGGAPYDLTLFESVQGISLASRVVKNSGSIICVAECTEGLPAYRPFTRTYHKNRAPETISESPSWFNNMSEGRWRARILEKVRSKSNVFLKSSNLSTEEIRGAGLIPVRTSVEQLVSEIQFERGGDSEYVCSTSRSSYYAQLCLTTVIRYHMKDHNG